MIIKIIFFQDTLKSYLPDKLWYDFDLYFGYVLTNTYVFVCVYV